MGWKTLWRQVRHLEFSAPESRRELSRITAAHWLVVRKFVDQLVGDSAAAYVLVEAHFSDKPEVTVEYLTMRLGSIMSEDTARRRLNGMVRRGAILRRTAGRTQYFRMKPEIAEMIIAVMHGEMTKL